MNPIAFEFGPMTVYWYGVFIGSGIALALLSAYFESRRRRVNPDLIMDGALFMLPVAFLGARLYYVLFRWEYYSSHPEHILAIWRGGLAIHGGILAAMVFFYFYARKKNEPYLMILDIVAPGVVLAQGVGRWGNFFNQEAHGGPVSEAFISRFPAFIQRGMLIGDTVYHPTFLYESVWNLGVFAILMLIASRRTKPWGLIAGLYIGLYSLGRFFIEGLRTDSLMLGPLRIAQVVSLSGVIAAVLILWWIHHSKDGKESPSDPNQ